MAHDCSFRFVGTTIPDTIPWEPLAVWYRNLVTRRAFSRLNDACLRDLGIGETVRGLENATSFRR